MPHIVTVQFKMKLPKRLQIKENPRNSKADDRKTEQGTERGECSAESPCPWRGAARASLPVQPEEVLGSRRCWYNSLRAAVDGAH